jgi:hypothetical protein
VIALNRFRFKPLFGLSKHFTAIGSTSGREQRMHSTVPLGDRMSGVNAQITAAALGRFGSPTHTTRKVCHGVCSCASP